jgi:hypothetical protein
MEAWTHVVTPLGVLRLVNQASSMFLDVLLTILVHGPFKLVQHVFFLFAHYVCP